MTDQTRIKDRSSLHRYRTELPNLIADSDLSVYAFRLYVHLKRRAGDDGACWEGTRAIAAACRMSMGQVSKAKQELLDKHLIEKTTRTTRGGQVDQITIVDLWPENFRKYSKEDTDESVHTVNTTKEAFTTRTATPESVHHTNALDESVHTVNVKCSLYEQEEEHVKNPDVCVSESVPVTAREHTHTRNELALAIAEACKIDPKIAISRQRKELNEAYRTLKKADATPDDVRIRERWWYDYDWRAKKEKRPPEPYELIEIWGKATAVIPPSLNGNSAHANGPAPQGQQRPSLPLYQPPTEPRGTPDEMAAAAKKLNPFAKAKNTT